MPDLEASIWQKYASEGVLVYGLHGKEDPALLSDFVEQTGITFPMLEDQGTLGRFKYPPGVGYPYPRDVVIGKDRTIRAIRNSFNPGELEALVQQLLAE